MNKLTDRTTKRFNRLLMCGVCAAAIFAATQFIGADSDLGSFSGAAYAQQRGQGGGGQGGGSQGGSSGQGGSGGQGYKGDRSTTGGAVLPKASESEEDSDRPDWAGKGGGGNPAPGVGDPDSDRPAWAGRGAVKPGGGGKPTTDRGDLYGDLYVILRDANGVPILKEIVTEKGTIYVTQPLDADGNLIPLDEEGQPIDETLVQEVELSRLNVARSPDKVTDRALSEAIATLNAATDVRTDAAGRFELLIDGEWTTIDSPIENLALYIDLMEDGRIDGVTNPLIVSKFPNLVDGSLTAADLLSAAALLGATADKFTTLTLDAVMYTNDIVGVNDPANNDYVDLTSIDYTRSSVYGSVTAEVLVDPEGDGTWTAATVNVYDAVFGGTDLTATAAAGFAQAVDDARAVLVFIHEYEVPTPVTQVGN